MLEEQVRLDALVRRALKPEPGETLREAAQRRLWRGGTRARWAARELLREGVEPWERMRRAALALGGRF